MIQMFCLSTAFNNNCSFNENNLILSFHSNEYKKIFYLSYSFINLHMYNIVKP